MSGSIKGLNTLDDAGLSISFHEEDNYMYEGGLVSDLGIYSVHNFVAGRPMDQGLDISTDAVVVEYDNTVYTHDNNYLD